MAMLERDVTMCHPLIIFNEKNLTKNEKNLSLLNYK